MMRTCDRWALAGVVLTAAVCCPARADVKLPGFFTDHMVLQRQRAIPIWGTASPGEKVFVTLAGKSADGVADGKGIWRVDLPALEAGGPHELVVKGSSTVKVSDVLVGEVWLCSGQSNMAMPVAGCKDLDLEIVTANYPAIRHVQIPDVMAAEPQRDVKAAWQVCSPATAANFSAVAYFYGRELHQALGVPIGLVNSSWGGTPAEAWVSSAALHAEPALKALVDRWDNGKQDPKLPPFFRPSAIYNGKIAPLVPYAMRGVIWYQGESNTGYAYQYRTLFPLLIKEWRKEWGEGDFPFYFVQIANLLPRQSQPMASDWAELREAQLMTMQMVAKTGMAITVDIGEANDIHPRNKQDVGRRLARWALAKDYGVAVEFCGPVYKSMRKEGSKIVLTFDHAAGGLMTFDKQPVKGFAVAGEDRQWRWAQAEISGADTVTVWSEMVSNPVAARYGWALNPEVSLYSKAGLPATPFRTDDWAGITANRN